ncbi:hypothetical protein MO973_07495 [Paenibacillus sp. TRM 82003]|nr:hypothetical protein [Paenibacillus sp. TRM 82003]
MAMVKRYALPFALGAFVLVALGAYYVHGATDRLPEFRLATVEGDPAEASGLKLSGSFIGRRGSAPVVVTADGSDYRDERSLYRNVVTDARAWFAGHPDLAEMLEQHRGFMRGKGWGSGFYRDEDMILYAMDVAEAGAASSTIRVNVERLDLASGRTASFTAPIKLPEGYDYGSVMDVQRFGDDLHLLMQFSGDTMQVADSVVRDYVFDIRDGSLLREVSLEHSVVPAEGDRLRLRVTTERLPSDPENFVIVDVIEEEIEEVFEGGYSSKTRSIRFFAYDYRTGALRETMPANEEPAASVSEESSEAYKGESVNSLDDGVFSRITYRDDRLAVTRERLDTGETTYTAFENAPFDIHRIDSVELQADKLLVLSQQEVPTVAVLGLPDGNLLYRGQAVPGDNASIEDAKQLRLMNVEAW